MDCLDEVNGRKDQQKEAKVEKEKGYISWGECVLLEDRSFLRDAP